MKKAVALILIIGTLFPLLHSCKKYEDGPLISFRGKEKRLTGVWDLTESSSDSGAVPDSLVCNTCTFGHQVTGGTFSCTGTGGLGDQTQGRWYWSDAKDSVATAVAGNIGMLHISDRWRIKRLKMHELWLEAQSGSTTYLFKYEKREE